MSSLLRHDADLLRQRRAPHRARLHDDHRRRARPLAPPARRRRQLPHRHRRARPEDPAGGRGRRASTPQEFADAHRARSSREAWERLDIANDDFIRTTEPRHQRGRRRAAAARATTPATSSSTSTRASTASLRGVLHRGRAARPATCARSTSARSSDFEEENYFFRLSRFEDRLLDWYAAHPDGDRSPSSERNEALGLIRQGLRDFSISRTSLDVGHPAAVGPEPRRLRLVRRADQLPHRGRLRRPTASASTDVVAGRLPPDRQGHHPLPLRVLAGDADVGRHRAAARAGRVDGWLLVGGEKMSKTDAATSIEPARPGRRRRRRRVPLLLPRRHAVRQRRRLHLRGAGRPLQRRPRQQPRQPRCRGSPRSSARSAAASARRRPPTARSPPRRPTAVRRRRPRRGTPSQPSRRPRGDVAADPGDQRLPRGQRAVEGRARPGGRRRARRRPRGAAHRRRPRLAGDPGRPRRRSGSASGSPGRVADQRLPEPRPRGAATPAASPSTKGDAAVPAHHGLSATVVELDRQPLPPPRRPDPDGAPSAVAAAPRPPASTTMITRRLRPRPRRAAAIAVAGRARRRVGHGRAAPARRQRRRRRRSSTCSTRPSVVAVGECGLDYHYDHSPRDVQREAFAAQIALAHEHGLPLVIHTREAWDDTFDILAAEGVPDAHGLPLLHRRARRGPARASTSARSCQLLAASSRSSGAADVREAAAAVPARPAARRDRQPVPGAGAPPRPAATGRPGCPLVGRRLAELRGRRRRSTLCRRPRAAAAGLAFAR